MAKTNKWNEIINKLENKLSFITINDELKNLLKSDREFDSLFSNILKTLVDVEKKAKINNEKSNNLINAYESITGKKFSGKSIKFNDADDIEDQLNYIDVFLKNVFGNDFDLNRNMSKQEIKNDEILETKIVDGEEIHNFNNQDSNVNNQNFNAEEFLRHNNVTADAVAEQLIAQQAQFLLKKDILENKVYKFDSKPKIVVWLKMINNVLFLLFALCAIVYAGLFWATPFIVKEGNNYVPISGGANIFVIMAVVLLTIFAAFKLYSEIRYFKNDNYKYNIKLTHIFFVAMIFIFFLIQFIDFLKYFDNIHNFIGNTFYWDDKNGWVTTQTSGSSITNTQDAYDRLVIIRIFIIALIAIFGCNIVLSFILMIIKPRVDLARLQEITTRYMQDIKLGKIDLSSLEGAKTSNPFGSMFF